MIDLKQVGIFINSEQMQDIAKSLQAWFASHHITTIVLDRETLNSPECDLVIAVGGDGTVLSALGRFSCPVLAINYGTTGFLTAGNPEDLDQILQRILVKDYLISERLILECQFLGQQEYAVNEIVLKGVTHLISVELIINGSPIRRIRGDGVIVGTATGSTAYLLSAGSPIVMPGVRCMIIAGLNEYNFSARNLLVSADSQIQLRIDPSTRETDIYLALDGKDKIPISVNETISICESSRKARLIFMEHNYFFNNLSSRLSW